MICSNSAVKRKGI